MQYWKPEAEDEFAGDMMPFWDGSSFHLFYLLDHDHHAEQNGLGGHQWAHAASMDLKNWEHFPLALPIGAPGSADQHGICTGSIFEHDSVYHVFYATRVKAPDGSVSEQFCRAVSRDLIHFEKSDKNPLFGAPPDYDKGAFRDPSVFQGEKDGLFHLLVTATRGGHGALAHYTSGDLDNWLLQEPFLVGRDGHSPECPEVFEWNGWWYLVYSHDAQMEYKTARSPLGPWQEGAFKTIESPTLRVPRTAAFTGNRRLAVGFLAWRDSNRDSGNYVYAGTTIFRELGQDPDGTLFTKFVPEMMPPADPPVIRLSENSRVADVPTDCTVSCLIVPDANAAEFGLLLRADAALMTGYRLRFAPAERKVTLEAWPPPGGDHFAAISDMDGLDQPADVQICLHGSVVDVCLNGRRTLMERGFDFHGTNLGFFGITQPVKVSVERHIAQNP